MSIYEGDGNFMAQISAVLSSVRDTRCLPIYGAVTTAMGHY